MKFSSTQVEKVRCVCLVLILIQNLHTTFADSIFFNLAKRMTSAVSKIYRRNDLTLPAPTRKQNDIELNMVPVSVNLKIIKLNVLFMHLLGKLVIVSKCNC